MKPEALQSLSIFQLVALYEKAAQAHGKAMEDGKPRAASKQTDIILSLHEEFRRREPEVRTAFLHMMSHESKWVRLLAATYALRFSPNDAEAVLRELAQLPGDCGFLAGFTLDQRQKGTRE